MNRIVILILFIIGVVGTMAAQIGNVNIGETVALLSIVVLVTIVMLAADRDKLFDIKESE